MRYYDNLETMLCNELDKIAGQGELNAGSLDMVQKLTHSLKSLKTIEAMDGYSGASYPHYNSRMYSHDGSKEQMLRTVEELRKDIEKMR